MASKFLLVSASAARRVLANSPSAASKNAGANVGKLAARMRWLMPFFCFSFVFAGSVAASGNTDGRFPYPRMYVETLGAFLLDFAWFYIELWKLDRPHHPQRVLFYGGEGVGGALNALPPYASVAR